MVDRSTLDPDTVDPVVLDGGVYESGVARSEVPDERRSMTGELGDRAALAKTDALDERSERALAAMRGMIGADLSACSLEDLRVLDGCCHIVRAFAGWFVTQVARRRDELWVESDSLFGEDDGDDGDDADVEPADGLDEGGPPGGGPSPALPAGTPVGGRDRRSADEAGRDPRRARALSLFPGFDEAFAAGEIDGEHVDALVMMVERLESVVGGHERVAAKEDTLLSAARWQNPSQFRRRCRDLVRALETDGGDSASKRRRDRSQVSTWTDREGMGNVKVQLDPERFAEVTTAIEEATQQVRNRAKAEGREISWQEARVQGFWELVTSAPQLDRRRPRLIVVADVDTLTSGVFGDGSLSETASGGEITPSELRRLACDAEVIPVVMSGKSLPLDVGTTQRYATDAQRAAIMAMSTECMFPGCSVSAERCEMHHVQFVSEGGPTDLANLGPACLQHHYFVHHLGWRVEMTADRVVRWYQPDGQLYAELDTKDRTRHRHDRDEPDAPPGMCPGPGR